MKIIIGSLIAIILLGLYAYAVIVSIGTAVNCTLPTCKISTGFSLVLNSIGGVVSALVITELAITKPNEIPAANIFLSGDLYDGEKFRKIITIIYLFTWVILGVTAFIVGVMQHPEKLPDLTSYGKAWLGFAVAALYAYFGVDKQS